MSNNDYKTIRNLKRKKTAQLILRYHRAHSPDDDADIIVSSMELKKLILERCDSLGINIGDVVKFLGLSNHFNTYYIKNWDQSYKDKRIRHHDVITLAKFLGINIRVTLAIEDKEKTSSRIFEEGFFNDYPVHVPVDITQIRNS